MTRLARRETISTWHRVPVAAAALSALAAFGIAPRAARGQVVLDGSVGPAGPRQGPNYVIPQSVGRVGGGNLLHSFSRFNVNTGESATFTAPAGAPVSNVIARVTGGELSNVNGALRSAIPGANFYLINPRGVVFGPEAQLDVGGSFAATTADYLRLADGTRIDARTAAAVTLTSAPPAAFGFLPTRGGAGGSGAAARATVSYTGGPAQPDGLRAPDGRSLSLVGGAVRIVSGRVQSLGGRVNVAAVGSGAGGEVAFDPAAPSSPLDVSSVRGFAPVDLLEGSSLRAPLGGSVVIRGGEVTVNRSSVNADTDATAGGGIDLSAAGRLALRNARVSSETFGPAAGGAIRLAARDLVVEGLLTDNPGPDPSVNAPVSANTTSTGKGGDIHIEAATVTILGDAVVAAFTSGRGTGGNIDVTAGRRLRIDGTGARSLTGVAAETLAPTPGNPGGSASGDIRLTAPRVQIVNTGEVTSTTRGPGAAGSITVRAGSLLIDGNDAPTLTGLQARVGVTGVTGASGAGGLIDVRAGRVRLIDGGVISATTFGTGPGGGIELSAGDVSLRGSAGSEFTGLFARSELPAETGAGGVGGDIRVRADALRLTGPAAVSASSGGAGNAGSVRIEAATAVRVSRGATLSTAAGRSRGGDVVVDAGRVLDADGAVFTAVSGGDGGNIALTAQAMSLRDTQVGTAAGDDGGDIRIAVPVAPLRRTRAPAAALGAPAGVGGTDGPTALVLQHSTVKADGGDRGGNVTIRPRALFLARIDVDRDITATGGAPELSGSVDVSPAETDLAGSLVALSAALSAESARLAPVCGVLLNGEVSSFVLTGRGGTPPEPGGWRADEWLAGERILGLPPVGETLSRPPPSR